MARDGSPRCATTLLLLALLDAGVWGWSTRNEFVFDDLSNILGNASIRNWGLLPQAFRHHVAGFGADSPRASTAP